MSERILIKFKASGDRKLQASMMKLAVTQSLLEKNTKKMNASLKRLEVAFLKTERGSRLLNNSFATMRSKMLLFSFAMSMGGRQLIQFAKQAAQIEGMETAFNTLSGGAENASVAIAKLTHATDGTMSNFDLFQQANNAMVLGITKNSDEMASMFDMAQRLGKALGVDTKRSVESLVTGIGRQSRLMLDNIGIIVKSDEAYQAYAEKLGISADKLTDVDKKQAFLNATLEAGREKLKKIGEEPDTAIDSFNRLGASWSNFTDEVGEAALEVFQPLMELAAELLKLFNKEKIQAYGLALSFVALNYARIRISAMSAATSTKIFNAAMKASPWALAVMGIGFVIDKFKIFGDSSRDLANSTDISTKKLYDFQTAAGLVTNTKDGQEMIKALKNQQMDAFFALNKLTNVLVADRDKYFADNKDKIAEAQALYDAYTKTIADLAVQNEKMRIADEKWKDELVPGVQQEIEMLKLQLDHKNERLTIEQEVLKAKQSGREFDEAAFRLALEEREQVKQQIKDNAETVIQTEKDKRDAIKKTERMQKSINDSLNQAMIAGINNNRRYAESFGQMLDEMLKKMVANAAVFGLLSMFSGIKGLEFLKPKGTFWENVLDIFHQGGQVQGYSTGGMIPLQGYATGGNVDNVPIMAQEGEYVLRRSAVESIGLENLNRMNRTGQVSGGANITFTGNIMSDSFIEEEAIPKIKDAIRRGANLGIS